MKKTGATAQYPKVFLSSKLKPIKRCILLVVSDHIFQAYFTVQNIRGQTQSIHFFYFPTSHLKNSKWLIGTHYSNGQNYLLNFVMKRAAIQPWTAIC